MSGTPFITAFCGSQAGVLPEFVQVAHEFGTSLVEHGFGLVFGGGSVGMMGAVSDAVIAAGGEVIGVIPQRLVDLEHGRKDLADMRVVPDMHTRKATMYHLSSGFAVLPGGVGTFDEFFEIFTWAKLGYHSSPIVVVNVADYYTPLMELLHHARNSGFITEADLSLVHFVDDVALAMKVLVAQTSR